MKETKKLHIVITDMETGKTEIEEDSCVLFLVLLGGNGILQYNDFNGKGIDALNVLLAVDDLEKIILDQDPVLKILHETSTVKGKITLDLGALKAELKGLEDDDD